MTEYRIKQVKIEGFKAFTTPQTIILDGKSVFIYGQNGLGKTSIAEAIMWCLFGSEPGKDTSVENVYYSGDCIVDLTLTNRKEQITFTRKQYLSGSDLKIKDSTGKEIKRQDINFPDLNNLAHGEGAHVIFAQQEHTHRYVKELSDFEGVIATYLDINRAKLLIEVLDSIIKDKEGIKQDIVNERENIRKKIEELRKEALQQKYIILKNPPWMSDTPPSPEETDEKILRLKKDIIEITGSEVKITDDRTSLLNQLRESLRTSANKEGIKKKLNEKSGELKHLNDFNKQLREANTEYSEADDEIKKLNDTLESLTSERKADDLKKDYDSLKESLDESEILVTLYRDVLDFLKKKHKQECPVCGGQITVDELCNKYTILSTTNSKNINHFKQIKGLLSQINEINKKIEEEIGKKSGAKEKIENLTSEIIRLLPGQGLLEITEEIVQKRLKDLSTDIETLQSELNKEDSGIEGYENQIKQLLLEVEYQDKLQKVNRIDELLFSDSLHRLDLMIEEYIDRIARLREIKKILEETYLEAFGIQLPSVNVSFNEVYQTLTRQKSFEKAKIVIDKMEEEDTKKWLLKIQVGSDNKGWYDPSLVLNGQAKSALNLVPYFAFSSLGMLQNVIELLIIDDPSQTFDNTNAEELLKILCSVSKTAQIVLTTHDEGRFNPKGKIPDFKIIRVSDFDVTKGPTIS